ncbi:hypothetical protein BDV96DRAFT_612335 [Lophiotrema nucula]|uniref:CorA-like transporter domain-containing protein n=1 Tax=Lophiotrema nucula TaxID=690887 RepID=A0A6A5Z8A8_9PLEO|nr:hypothetical protein BDV96DRAFT_612335 [Lophiotrema nucula]
MGWVWDGFDTYRLDKDKLENYLEGEFGTYDFYVQVKNGEYRFWIPKKLTDVRIKVYQDMPPSFLDFVFPFGRQEHAQDFHFSGLRDDSRLDKRQRGLQIPELGRSGRDIRLSYNLRSVERSPRQVDLQWSIRQTAVYHSFDLDTGHSLWVTVKGNKLIKNRVLEATNTPEELSGTTNSQSFAASLATHLMLAEWAGENWRWYINDLERELHKSSKGTLAAPVDTPPSPVALHAPRSPKDSKDAHGPIHSGISSRSATLSSRDSPTLRMRDDSPSTDLSSAIKSLTRYLRIPKIYARKSVVPETSRKSVVVPELSGYCLTPSTGKMQPPELPPEIENSSATFPFSDLQHVQYVEEKLQEARSMFKTNKETLMDLRTVYKTASEHGDFPDEIRSGCGGKLLRFSACIEGIEKDLRMQEMRTDTLLRLLADRKALLHGILRYRSMKASEFFAKEAKASADNMEIITSEMHEIARKTKKETVSMRIITLVTLFFLPGTFVATFMSTDIIRFSDKRRDFQPKALKIYLAISLPMMAATFLAWFVLYRIARYREKHTGRVSRDLTSLQV